MEYKINEIATIAGISTRTLRYYDQIGLLIPSKLSDANYRLYTESDVNLLQQIRLYKTLGFSLTTIKDIVHSIDFKYEDALQKHKNLLILEQHRISTIIKTIDHTLQHYKGETTMKNDEKFIGFKEKIIAENEETYGEELREKYGSEIIDNSYQKMRKMSTWEFQEAERLGQEILSKLALIYTTDPVSKDAQELCKLHQTWIQLYWPTYSKEAHYQLVKMYTEDERFTAYYDKVGSGATTFLYQAMKHYLQK